MLPILATVPIAASVLNGLMNVLNGRNAAPKSSDQTSFKEHLLARMRDPQELQSVGRIGSIQTLIALQQAMGPLQPELQITLARQLLHRTVQVRESGGSGVVGEVTGARMENGQMHLMIRGQSYPLTSLQAMLHGVM